MLYTVLMEMSLRWRFDWATRVGSEVEPLTPLDVLVIISDSLFSALWHNLLMSSANHLGQNERLVYMKPSCQSLCTQTHACTRTRSAVSQVPRCPSTLRGLTGERMMTSSPAGEEVNMPSLVNKLGALAFRLRHTGSSRSSRECIQWLLNVDVFVLFFSNWHSGRCRCCCETPPKDALGCGGGI